MLSYFSALQAWQKQYKLGLITPESIFRELYPDFVEPQTQRQQMQQPSSLESSANVNLQAEYDDVDPCIDERLSQDQRQQPLSLEALANVSYKLEFDDVKHLIDERLRQGNFIRSKRQPDTKADGNCFLYGLMDQIRYVPT